MPYTPTVWVDEVPASTPVKYVITDDVDGEIAGSATIAPVTTIDTTGTPVNAANLNKLEAGVETAQDDAETAQATAAAAIAKSTLTAKGDIIVGSAAATPAVLAKPSVSSFLEMDSSGNASWSDKVNAADGSEYSIQAVVSSNNLSVLLKRPDDTTPTASDPIKIKIGQTLYTITETIGASALAGTNWLDCASSGNAGQVIQFFVYATYISGVMYLGFSRLPYGTKLGDFHATQTNPRGFVRGGSTPSADIPVTLLGRFEAKLSSGNNWSDAGNIIHRPIYETDWLTFVPATSASAGSWGNVSKLMRYRLVGLDIIYECNTRGTLSSSDAESISITTPFLSSSGGRRPVNAEVDSAGEFVNALATTGASILFYRLAANWPTTAITNHYAEFFGRMKHYIA